MEFGEKEENLLDEEVIGKENIAVEVKGFKKLKGFKNLLTY